MNYYLLLIKLVRVFRVMALNLLMLFSYEFDFKIFLFILEKRSLIYQKTLHKKLCEDIGTQAIFKISRVPKKK